MAFPVAFAVMILSLVACMTPILHAQVLSPDALADRLHREHPRLLARGEDFDRLLAALATDAILQRWRDALVSRGERVIGEPVSEYEIPDGKRLLATSRRVVERVMLLGMLHRLDGDARWSERAWRELEAAAAFPDWNPSHFLDTAEMTYAFALGYDWMHDAWSDEQRAVLRRAIVEKGLTPALACYRGEESYGWWTRSTHNWNQVCNGGVLVGALAVADEEPELAAEVIGHAVRLLPAAMTHFAPDGGWNEGPAYWHYAIRYNVPAIAALVSALGDDFGLASVEGFADAGWFPIFITGPTGRTFNFADGGDGTLVVPEMLWLAKRFDQPAFARYQLGLHGLEASLAPRLSRPPRVAPFDLLWYDAALAQAPQPEPPLVKHFRGLDAVTLRSAWGDADAWFVGVKAGRNGVNHGHLDAGSFVLDWAGERWVVDLGSDNYNLPHYFGKDRWTYYRHRAEGHNTLVINPDAEPDQDTRATTRVLGVEERDAGGEARLDLTAAYARHATRVRRDVRLGGAGVELVDDVTLHEPGAVWWFVHTRSEVVLSDDGRAATLRQGGRTLRVRLESPNDAAFALMPARPLPSSPDPAGQDANEGVRKLAIELRSVGEARIAVRFEPGDAE